MKFIRQAITTLAALLIAATALAQTYPTANPTYIPTAQLAPQAFTTTGDYNFVANGVSVTSIRISGTCTSLVAAPQVTNDGTNWTTVNAYPVPSGASSNSLTTTGLWRINTSGATKARLHITTLAASCTVAMAGTPGTSAVTETTPADPCQSASVLKSSAVVNIGAATTTKIVDVSGSTAIYVCGLTASLAGTTPSITFKSGTNVSTDCDTGAATLSGVILPTSGSLVTLNAGGGTVLKTAASKQLCGTTVGTGSSFQGILTYVQQ